MKFKLKKVYGTLFLASVLLFFVFLNSPISFAESTKDIISVTDNVTGETIFLDEKDIEIKKIEHEIKSVPYSNSSADVNRLNIVEGYEIFIPEEKLNLNTSISPFSTESGSKNEGGVSAVLKVDYDVNSTNEKVRLNKVYGSWTPKSSNYKLSERMVTAHSGVIWGKKITKYPSSNSFSYKTGWGYNDRVFDYNSAPRAQSSAKITIVGMSGSSHTIKINFVYSI